eukprot:CAMPEP_0198578884 /NCGR_PEP_ID=MMETSP1462-20131121/120794_1 /TAXON_ID=1333877 /ORGANISM="Brandtodinium nutriculum, Strain RCC3387" /LENGTH=54 /DNA_ID=CAMNT_0044310191 /DNA_START=8 /DNA_END=169 /DNA_ORIENTATION=+
MSSGMDNDPVLLLPPVPLPSSLASNACKSAGKSSKSSSGGPSSQSLQSHTGISK